METQSFIKALKSRLTEEYNALLVPFSLEEHTDGLVQGKFMRSRIAYSLVGDTSQKLVELCTALEMLHASSLVHDDIIDKASLRRGKPTLYKKSGIEQALLVGNMLFGRVFQIAANSDTAFLRHVLATYMRLNIAQEQEIVQRGNLEKSLQDSLDIYDGKTAAMFELSVKVGLSVSQNGQEAEAVIKAINRVGLAFQIVDDVEDLKAWLDQRNLAKTKRDKVAAYDIELGDYTLPIIYALTEERSIKRKNWYIGVSQTIWDTAIAQALQDATAYLDEAVHIVDKATTVPAPFRDLIRSYNHTLINKGISSIK